VYQEQAPVAQQEKKGWSAKAKGAVIGAGAGAVAGAIIHKRQRGVGAVVGGVLGAGAGTGIGAIIDKKNGR
jgi:phage tail tape-measure protein